MRRKKRDKFYSDGRGGTNANGTVPCDEDGNLLSEDFPETISEEEFAAWREKGKELVKSNINHQWAIGQWVVEGEELKELAGMTVDQRFKNSVYKSAADITGYSVMTVKSLANVVRNIDDVLLDEFRLSFAHFKLVASPSISIEQKRNLLSEMQRSNLNVAESRAKVQLRLNPAAKPKRDSVANRKVAKALEFCDKLTDLLDNHDLGGASAYAVLQFRLMEMGAAIAEFVDAAGIQEQALVSNQRELAAK
jgi:hypothetical protein